MTAALANSVWGVILARYVTPALVVLVLATGGWIGARVIADINDVANAQASFRTDLVGQASRITAIEARRDAVSKARDEQISRIIDAQSTAVTQINTIANQVAAVSAKVEILLDREGK